jgi:uncharacterized protein (DUF433 family)
MKQKGRRLKASAEPKLVRANQGGDDYDYYPIGTHVVIAPGVCGGRPTFRGTRIEVETILEWLRDGRTITDILEGYPSLTRKAVKEAIGLAGDTLKNECARIAA